MLLALALYASTTHAGIPAGFGGTPGVINENTPRYDLEPLYHDGKAHGRKREVEGESAPARRAGISADRDRPTSRARPCSVHGWTGRSCRRPSARPTMSSRRPASHPDCSADSAARCHDLDEHQLAQAEPDASPRRAAPATPRW